MEIQLSTFCWRNALKGQPGLFLVLRVECKSKEIAWGNNYADTISLSRVQKLLHYRVSDRKHALETKQVCGWRPFANVFKGIKGKLFDQITQRVIEEIRCVTLESPQPSQQKPPSSLQRFKSAPHAKYIYPIQGLRNSLPITWVQVPNLISKLCKLGMVEGLDIMLSEAKILSICVSVGTILFVWFCRIVRE